MLMIFDAQFQRTMRYGHTWVLYNTLKCSSNILRFLEQRVRGLFFTQQTCSKSSSFRSIYVLSSNKVLCDDPKMIEFSI